MIRHRVLAATLALAALASGGCVYPTASFGQVNRADSPEVDDPVGGAGNLEESYSGDLPPLPRSPLDDVESTPLRPKEAPASDASKVAEDVQPSASAENAEVRAAGRSDDNESLEQMLDLESERRGPIPEDAWQKAWDHIQRMPAAEPPAPSPLEGPQSWFLRLNQWFARTWHVLGPGSAFAQSSYQWVQIGPAPFSLGQYTNAGFSSEAAIDPSDLTLNTLYVGTLGGVFKTTSGGQNWAAVTDDQSSPRARKVVAHPNVSGAVRLWAGF